MSDKDFNDKLSYFNCFHLLLLKLFININKFSSFLKYCMFDGCFKLVYKSHLIKATMKPFKKYIR